MSKAAATDTGGKFVDHGFFVAGRYKTLGYSAVIAYCPRDHTHTSPAGAETVRADILQGADLRKLGAEEPYVIGGE